MMKRLIDVSFFGGAFRLMVNPGKFVHWATLHIKGIGELSVEFASQKMLDGPAYKDLDDALEDEDFGNPDETMMFLVSLG